MAELVGGIYYEVDLDDKKFQAGVKRTSASAKGLSNSLGSAGKGISGFFGEATSQLENINKKLFVIGAAGTAALGLMAKKVLDITGNLEQVNITFRTLLGSQEKADKLMGDIKKKAVETPFTLPQLFEGTKSLLAYGIAEKDVVNTLMTLGNLASAVGTEKMPQFILALGQVHSKTVLAGDDLRQFSETGIPLTEELARVTGHSAKEISSGVKDLGITYDQVFKALENISGRYGDVMGAQSKSLKGIFSNISDTFTLLIDNIVKKSGLFDVIKDAVKRFYDYVNGNSDKIIAWFLNIGNIIRDQLTKAKPTIDKIVSSLVVFGGWVAAHKDEIIAFLKGAVVAFAAFEVITSVIALVAALTSPLTLIVVAIGLLSLAWTKNWGDIQGKTFAVITFISNAWNTYGVPLFNRIQILVAQLTVWFSLHWNEIKGIFMGAWTYIKGIFQAAWGSIQVIVGMGMILLTGNWRGGLELIKKGTENALGGVKKIFSGIWQELKNITSLAFDWIVTKISGYASSIVYQITHPFETAKKQLDGIIGDIKGMMDTINPFHRNSPSLVDNVRSGVADIVYQYDKMKNSLTTMQLRSSFSGVVGNVETSSENKKGSGLVTVNQNINANIGNSIDVTMLAQQLAFKVKNSL